MIGKIEDQHRQKAAYIYLRQSSMAQVRHHQESTERQYALKQKALELGWTPAMIRTLDRDLGISGTQMTGREDFKTLMADVCMGKVGAVFALEASRLGRSCADWHRLMEFCALTNTLIIDEDGCYNTGNFNDRLLPGLKATMSQAELHFMSLRLQGGRLNKAKKGELRFPLPAGFCCDPDGRTVVDPDQQVQGAVRLLLAAFRQTGSAYGVVHHFAQKAIQFPKRAYGGLWNGRLIWGRLAEGRVRMILKNPAYAGVYAFGRFRCRKQISSEGQIQSKITAVPMTSWTVAIPDHHEAYITWEEFLENQMALLRNLTCSEENILTGPAREGLALLQGVLLCGNCGRRLTVRYQGNGGIYPTYECNWLRREGLATGSCLHVRCSILDDADFSRYPSSHRVSRWCGSRLHLSLAGSPTLTGRIEFVILRMDRSRPAAPHPASRRRSSSWLQAGERIPEEDFHLSDHTRFQAHWGGFAETAAGGTLGERALPFRA